MTKLNPEQHEAVMSLGQNIVVSASAGAGKTAVLIERLMKRILVDHVGITEITALTFTDAAANEMKIRLLGALNKAYQEEKDLDILRFIKQQITLVETANISTIHSYCLTLIKNYGYILGLDPARTQNILDPAIADNYKEVAMDKTLNRWFKDHKDAMDILLKALVRNPINLNPLKTSIQAVAQYLASKPNRKEAITSTLSLYQAKDFEDLPLNIQKEIFKPYYLHIQIIIESMDAYLEVSRSLLPDTKYHEDLSRLMHHFDQLLEIKKMIEKEDFGFYDRLVETLDIVMPSVRKSQKLDETLVLRYKETSETLSDAINGLLKLYESKEVIFKTLHLQYDYLHHLFNIAMDYLAQYDLEKEKANGFDFDDFEYYALQILRVNDQHIAKLIRTKTKEIMVDEYQDTNEIQDEIIRLVSTGNNIFRVGDVKQSIYRFRGAKPTIMQRLLGKPNLNTIHFMYNYRSKQNIVGYNNTLFKEIMHYTQNSEYTDKDWVKAGNFKAEENDVPVELNLVYIKEDEEDDTRLRALDRNKLHAKEIANRIIELHVNDKIDFKDITVLSRTHVNKIYLKEAFEAANIPHFIDDRSGFFRSNVINKMMAWLNYMVYPHDIYLLEILSSPFIGLTLDDVAMLKVNHTSISKGLQVDYPHIYQFIKDKNNDWRNLDIVNVLTEMMNINDVYHKHLSIQVKSNLDFLLDKAITFQASNNPSIQGFIHYVRNLKDENNSESTPLSLDEDVVRVTTIHQSKGLQYPVTILWPMGKRLVQDFKQDVLTDDTFGVLPNDVFGPYNQRRKNYLRKMAEFKQDQEDLEEYIRLLYVALTRAENRLIMIDVVDKIEFPESLSYHLLQNFKRSTDLILPIKAAIHLVRSYKHISEVKALKLDASIKLDHNQIFTPRLDLPKMDIVSEDVSFEFSFNENFIHGIAYGNILHQAVETLPHRKWTKQDLVQIPQNFHSTLIAYNTHHFTQTIYTMPNLYHEVPFLYLENEVPKQGIIDFYAVSENRLILVDFKSDAVDRETLLQRYHAQVMNYKKALELEYPGLECECYIYSFNLKDYIEVPPVW